MNTLTECIDAALVATRDLRTKLEDGDLVGCVDLLEKREKALADFRDVYDRSSEEERARHHGLLEDLVKADEVIGQLADGQRLAAAAELARTPHAHRESTEPVNACLDRRA